MKGDAKDPKGLIQESYRIENVTAAECRTIFLDWALGVPAELNVQDEVKALLVQYADEPADHPMTQTLIAALRDAGPPKRRGGRAGRVD